MFVVASVVLRHGNHSVSGLCDVGLGEPVRNVFICLCYHWGLLITGTIKAFSHSDKGILPLWCLVGVIGVLLCVGYNHIYLSLFFPDRGVTSKRHDVQRCLKCMNGWRVG